MTSSIAEIGSYSRPYLPQSKPSLISSLDEERREVFLSVLRTLRIEDPDPDRLAACNALLCHLARTGARRSA